VLKIVPKNTELAFLFPKSIFSDFSCGSFWISVSWLWNDTWLYHDTWKASSVRAQSSY